MVAIAAGLASAYAHCQSSAPLTVPNIALKVQGQINAWVRQPDGGFVLGGRFLSVNGEPRTHLARLRPDGSLDLDWYPQLDGEVHALAVDASGAVYVGGAFTRVNGATREHLVRLSAAGNGSPDPTWIAQADGAVKALAFDEASGGLFVGGRFSSLAGVARRHIAKLSHLAASPVDPDWNPSSDFEVEALVPDGRGAVFARGSIHPGPESTVVFNDATKYQASGSGLVSPEWNPESFVGLASLAVHPGTGAVYVGGYNGKLWQLANITGAITAQWDFPEFGASEVRLLAVDGASNTIYAGARSRLIRLANGTVPDSTWIPSLSSTPRVLAFGAGGTVYAGGTFGRAGSEILLSTARIEADGGIHRVVDIELPGYANVLEMQPSGGTIVAGAFLKADGLKRDGMFRLTPEGSVDPDWNPSPGSDSVRSIAINAVNGQVYVSGTFDVIGGQSRPFLAKLDGAGTGAADPDWNPSPVDEVLAIAVDDSGAVFVGGLFDTRGDANSVGGQKRDFLAKLDGNGIGAADPDWNPDPDSLVDVLTLDSTGRLFVAGQFSNIGGQERDGLAKLSAAAGQVDPDWNPSMGGRARGMVPDDNGNLYVFGMLPPSGNGPQSYLSRVSMSGFGLTDPDWDPAPEGHVNALTIGSAGSVYVGGVFTSIGNRSINHLAKLAAVGTGLADARWNANLGEFGVAYLAFDDRLDGLLVGGRFETVANQSRDGFAAIGVPLFSDGFEPTP